MRESTLALLSRKTKLTAEGAAYLAAVSLSVHPERFVRCEHADASPFASLLRVSEAFHVADGPAWVTSVKADPKFDDSFHPELKVAGFQREVAKEGHPLVSEMPEWLYTHSTENAMEQLYQCVTLLYLASAGDQAGRGTGRAPGAAGAGLGNFLTLHLLTSLWAVEHDTRPLDASAQGLALQCYWSMLWAIANTSNPGLPTRETLEVVLEKYPLAASLSADATRSIDSSEWKSVIDAAIAEVEEHNQKLVYVLSQLHQSLKKRTFLAKDEQALLIIEYTQLPSPSKKGQGNKRGKAMHELCKKWDVNIDYPRKLIAQLKATTSSCRRATDSEELPSGSTERTRCA
ncbi:MAG: hypothetical protein SGPRY_007256 [Prymnesium sp.]